MDLKDYKIVPVMLTRPMVQAFERCIANEETPNLQKMWDYLLSGVSDIDDLSDFLVLNKEPITELQIRKMFGLKIDNIHFETETCYRVRQSELVDIVRMIEKVHGIGV